jgi:large subunit ribosomal protein L9
MPLKVILLERMRNLGDLGDEVAVKPGYGRNYLIPQGKAVPATKQARATFEARRAELEASARARHDGAAARAAKLDGLAVTVAARASDEGHLYGSVGTREIADAVVAKGFELVRNEVLLPEGALRNVGEYEVALALHSDVSATIRLTIIPE